MVLCRITSDKERIYLKRRIYLPAEIPIPISEGTLRGLGPTTCTRNRYAQLSMLNLVLPQLSEKQSSHNVLPKCLRLHELRARRHIYEH